MYFCILAFLCVSCVSYQVRNFVCVLCILVVHVVRLCVAVYFVFLRFRLALDRVVVQARQAFAGR